MKRVDCPLNSNTTVRHGSNWQPVLGPSRQATWLLAAAVVIVLLGGSSSVHAQAVHWVWAGEHSKDKVPQAACHFRKSFKTEFPQEGRIVISADDQFELHVNGRSVGKGSGWQNAQEYDITKFLRRGKNLIAIKVTNTEGGSAGLAARLTVKEKGGTHVAYSTDASWKVKLRPLAFWQSPRYSDLRWQAAKSFGLFGKTAPWNLTSAGDKTTNELGRFKLNPDFDVQTVADHATTESLTAMTFNEFGSIVASRENGPILLISDTNGDKIPDKTRVYCEEVKSCQGLLALNGDIFAVGSGPDGMALYRLSDTDRDGQLEVVKTLLKFQGEAGEHGPHGLTLGPDGFLYVTCGNHSAPIGTYAPTSPYRDFAEGDLVQPRLQDPGGHALNVAAPGGVILRTDIEGKTTELVAGGLRNTYDLAFNRWGDLFTHDSDMESDIGTTWYKPTRVLHVTPGADFGWRSGWAKWPEYFLDGLPSTVETGRGSPTGAVVYDHVMFPRKYQGSLFVCDWAQGRILAVHLQPNGSSLTATSEVFLEGRPLNVTDIEVGPDGALYFCTGGRDTAGGIYRIAWRGTVPDSISDIGTGIRGAIRQPQLQSSWSRQQVALFKQEIGSQWDRLIQGVATTQSNSTEYRTRALDLMHLYGPTPSAALLLSISQDTDYRLRSRAARLMAGRTDTQLHSRLIAMLSDEHALVRRLSCQSLTRHAATVPANSVVALLESEDRFEAFAARRLLERIPVTHWREQVLTSSNHRIFCQGSIALLTAEGNKQTGLDVLEQIEQRLGTFINDRDFADMLRVGQIAMARGKITADDIPSLAARIADEFPTTNHLMNRELIRILAHLQTSTIADRCVAHLSTEMPQSDRFHLALHYTMIQSGWSVDQKMAILQHLEDTVKPGSGHSLAGYVEAASKAFLEGFDWQQKATVLRNGERMPNAALAVLFLLPRQLDDAHIDQLIALDKLVADKEGRSFTRLGVGVIAVLARDGNERSMEYLRTVFDASPERRHMVAMGLAQSPNKNNWAYLIRSLSVLEGPSAQTVLMKLKEASQKPTEPEAYRQVILRGLALKNQGGQHAVALLEHWTGKTLGQSQLPAAQQLVSWQQWFATTYPDHAAAELPKESDKDKWSLTQLVEYIQSDEGAHGSPERGVAMFHSGQCSKCHRKGPIGESMGPDLTGLAGRFQKKEILESIVFPSHVISDQYSSKSIVTTDGRVVQGIVAPGAGGSMTLLQSSGEKLTLRKGDIDEMTSSKTSVMPSGLLNSLSLQDVADLMAFLTSDAQPSLAERPQNRRSR